MPLYMHFYYPAPPVCMHMRTVSSGNALQALPLVASLFGTTGEEGWHG